MLVDEEFTRKFIIEKNLKKYIFTLLTKLIDWDHL